VINGDQALVHAHDLQLRNPTFYQQLQGYAKQHQYLLVADRRHQEDNEASGRRKAWLPVIVLSLGISSAMATDKPGSTHTGFADHSSQTVLSLFLPNEHESLAVDADLPRISKPILEETEDSLEYEFPASDDSAPIEAILLDHYTSNDNDPDYILQDILQIARYLSQYPEAVAIINDLADHSWQLRYDKNTFETEVRGNSFQVQAVDIRFDSRAAAQLRNHKSCATNANACIASPADALLHELLHAKSALLETTKFIAQGGLSSVLYPYAHEYEVIKNENTLYRSMSARDGVLRPQRHAHAGKLVASSCSFCIQ
jgi:hypothetical protein